MLGEMKETPPLAYVRDDITRAQYSFQTHFQGPICVLLNQKQFATIEVISKLIALRNTIRFIAFGARLAHLAYHAHKGGY